ncbi:hypothetical protein [Erythrobacter phage vB_EliS-L02]|nr:hypothetical protein [Erythrobacter phage vB_EliS-L02]
MVDEVKTWGVMAYHLVVSNDGGSCGQAYIRLENGTFEKVGTAVIVTGEAPPEPEPQRVPDPVDYASLVGASIFNIVPLDPKHPFDSDANGTAFMLGGVTYMCFEDPEDGYRSTAGPLTVAHGHAYQLGGTGYTQIDEPVVVAHIDDNYLDIVRVTSAITGKVIFEVGTCDVDDYYPSFHTAWHPENLSANAQKRIS